MRSLLKTTTVFAILVLCAGCPWFALRFTNADVGGGGGLFNGGIFGMAPAGMSDAEGMGGGEEQVVREVVEPDVIRRDGSTLYVLNQYRGLTLVDLDEEKILSQVATYGYPRDLYVVGDRAYVLVGYAYDYTIENNMVTYTIGSRVYVIDVSDPADATILKEFTLEGDFVDSRLVGDVLYAVCANFEWYWDEPVGVAEAVSSRPGKATVTKEQTSSSWVTSINVADPENIHQVDEESLEGLGDVIQATDFAIFVAGFNWEDDTTRITYVDISDPAGAITVRGAIEIPGYVADRFKMDAYEGVLRVVSSEWNWETGATVHITTIDLANPDELTKLGQTVLEDATGESLFATRFDGPRGYIVTFFIVDPLFVVDFSDPANPAVSGQLEVPGWSTHIEPQGDRLIALGVDDTEGRRVCVSLFDVSDTSDPQLLERVSFGEGWSWSSAYDDVKAFAVFEDMLLVPFSGWSSSFGGYDRLQFISYTQDDLEAQGYVDLDGHIRRSFEYNGNYYGVTDEQLATIDAADPAEPTVVNRLTLAEYVADYLELSPTVAVEIITQYDSGKTVLRTVDLAGAKGDPLGSIELAIGGLTDAYVYGESIVLVSTEWDKVAETDFYVVLLVDCSTPAEPELSASIKVGVRPYWGGWYWWDYGYGDILPGVDGIGLEQKASHKQIAPRWNLQGTAFLLGDTLALRCTADHFDTTFGEVPEAYEGLALVDLVAQEVSGTIGFAYESVSSLDAAGGKLYLGTTEYAGSTLFRPLCAYYLREIDVSGPTVGEAVNVPGAYVQYHPGNDILTVRDDQWRLDWSVTTVLRTASWNGSGPIELADKFDLPEDSGNMLARGAKIYVDGYDEDGSYVSVISVSEQGDLSLMAERRLSDKWADVLDAHGSKVYVTIGSAIACYDVDDSEAAPQLVQMMGSPLSVRFGTESAYVPLGYSGVAILPL